MMPIRLPQYALPALLIVFVLLGLAFNLAVPLGEAPDEVSHWSYVEFLTSQHSLPKPEGAVVGESHQPPLYYLVATLATFWIPRTEYTVIANPDFALGNPQTPNLLLHTRREAFPYHDVPLVWHVVRVLSVVMGAVTVCATWQIGTELVPNDRWIAFGAAAFVAFLPEFTFLSAVVNNDNLVITLSSLAVLKAIQCVRARASMWDFATLGVLLGLAGLAKLSGLTLWPFVALVFLCYAWKSREWKRIGQCGMLVLGIAVTILLPWTMYNMTSYGDPLGWSRVLSVTPVRQAPMTWQDLGDLIKGLYTSFWGRFGGALHLHMAGIIYTLLAGLPLLALLGWLKGLGSRTADAFRRQVLGLVAVFWIVMLAAFARWTLTELGTDQARQLFPGLPLLAVFLTVGLALLFPARKELSIALSTGVLLGLNIAVLLHLTFTFSPLPPTPASLQHFGGSAAPFDFGKTIRILDYRVQPVSVIPGETVAVEVNWQALANPNESLMLLLQLTGGGEPVANKDGTPSAGRPTTDWWQKDQVFTSRHTLTIPNDLAPGIYTLRLGLHPFDRWEWLPVQGAEMLQLDRIIVAGSR